MFFAFQCGDVATWFVRPSHRDIVSQLDEDCGWRTLSCQGPTREWVVALFLEV